LYKKNVVISKKLLAVSAFLTTRLGVFDYQHFCQAKIYMPKSGVIYLSYFIIVENYLSVLHRFFLRLCIEHLRVSLYFGCTAIFSHQNRVPTISYWVTTTNVETENWYGQGEDKTVLDFLRKLGINLASNSYFGDIKIYATSAWVQLLVRPNLYKPKVLENACSPSYYLSEYVWNIYMVSGLYKVYFYATLAYSQSYSPYV